MNSLHLGKTIREFFSTAVRLLADIPVDLDGCLLDPLKPSTPDQPRRSGPWLIAFMMYRPRLHPLPLPLLCFEKLESSIEIQSP